MALRRSWPVALAAGAVVLVACGTPPTPSPSLSANTSSEPIAQPPPAAVDPDLVGRLWPPVATFEEAQGGTDIRGVAIGPTGVLVAVGGEPRGGAVWVSTDGSSRWRRASEASTFDAAQLTGVTAFGDGFVAVGTAADRPAAWQSTDGTAWEPAQFEADAIAVGGLGILDVATDGQHLVAVGMGIWFSDDGLNWRRVADPPAELLGGAASSRIGLAFSPVGCTGSYTAVSTGGPGFVAIGAACSDGSALVLTSKDGVEWDAAPDQASLGRAAVHDLLDLDGELLAVGAVDDHAAAWRSVDGRDWSLATEMGSPGLAGGVMRAVTRYPGGLAAIGGAPEGFRGAVWVSSDGSSWQRVSAVGNIDDADTVGDLIAAPSGLVAVGARDAHAAVWTSPPLPPSRNPEPIETPTQRVVGAWQEVSPLPQPGYLAATTGPDGRIYVFGAGEAAGEGEVRQVVQIYDARLDRWDLQPSRFGPLNDAPQPVLVDNAILLVEWFFDTGVSVSLYDPTTNAISDLGPRLKGFSSARAAPSTGSLLVYAMDEAEQRPHLFDFNPASGGWTELAAPPGYVIGMTAGHDGRLYALIEQRMYAYDPATDAWNPGARKPTPRGDFAMISGSDGYVYVIGGFTEDRPDPNVEVYDPTTDTWATGPDLPSPRSYPAAAVSGDGTIYLIGGTNAALNQVDTVEALAPAGLRLP